MLAAVGLVVIFVILPLLGLGGGRAGSPGASASATVEASAAPGSVVVPQTVGLSTADAIAAAQEAGLDWTVFCNHDESRPEGIVDQEPPAGMSVAPGSAFSMYSARVSDCQ